MRVAATLALLLGLSVVPGVLAAGPAILPVKMLDTSHEARDQQAEHARRTALMAEVLADELGGQLVAADEVARACPRETAECLLGVVRAEGAERGLFIVVQKSSTLILNVFADLVEPASGKVVLHRELNFRGDNDEAWRRAARFLARELKAAG